ncbi:hypothetical protein BDW59DRAFT_147018 [Aspergillus cavernicola]|uniref:gamma-glutamylcyclotransferase n=1 Tax=Aspergillus cavernicola TaxID=176166 RepID=A0ABR4IAK1_9EURO
MHLQQDLSQDPSIPPLLSVSTTTTTANPTPQIPLHTQQHDRPEIQNDLLTPAPKKSQHLYFAYGSNLSPTQMHLRCTHNPSFSAHPVALAALDNWRWLICEFGYANVLPPAGLRVGNQISAGAAAVPESVSGEIPGGGVFGVLYEMSQADERVLDGYEGVDHCSSLVGSSTGEGGGSVPASIRPREQGAGEYNKWYVRARVVKWLDEGYRARNGLEGEGGEARVLVYVDEMRVKLGDPKDEYIPRMNRAIKEAVQLGFPGDWAARVMRPSIPLISN